MTPRSANAMKVAEQYDFCVPFFERLRQAHSRTLLLDYDGTLAPFTNDRNRAFPYPEIPELVSGIMRTGTRVVLVSGRAATELLFLIRIDPQPEIWGSHGMERLHADGSYVLDTLDPLQHHALQAAKQDLRDSGLGDYLEIKPGSVAVHWRGLSADKQHRIANKVRAVCGPAVSGAGLELLSFDGGLELRIPGKTKGDAVEAVLSESKEDTVAAYLGDDQTDENAFRAIKGRGLAVLVRPEYRPTAANVWLRPPEELVHFLRDWLVACGAEE